MFNCFNPCPRPCCNNVYMVNYPNLTIGTVTTGTPGSSANASITTTNNGYALNLTLPQGQTGPIGPMPTLEIGTVTVGTGPTDASATLTPTSTGYALNLVLPIAN